MLSFYADINISRDSMVYIKMDMWHRERVFNAYPINDKEKEWSA